MYLTTLLFAILLSAIFSVAIPTIPTRFLLPHTKDGQTIGGGKYGFTKCINKGVRPGKISCFNFDSIQTSQETALGPAPKSPLLFSPQWNVFNVTRGTELGIVPVKNLHSAVSSPNALIVSRYNPEKMQGDSVPTISRPYGETFDLFGFYVQPMELPPGVKGVDLHVRGVTAEGEEFVFDITFLPGMKDPWYFEPYTLTLDKWDGLTQVNVWAELSGMEEGIDWELFMDDLWVRWPNETESTVVPSGLKVQEELK